MILKWDFNLIYIDLILYILFLIEFGIALTLRSFMACYYLL